MLNRRYFMLAGTSAIASATAIPNVVASTFYLADKPSGITEGTETDAKSPTALFKSRLNQRFLARGKENSALLQLRSVESGTEQPHFEQFSLVFDANTPLPDNVYKLTHVASLQSIPIRLERRFNQPNQYVALLNLLK